MKRAFLVSYPRSGQHYTADLIRESSGVDDYCELYNCYAPNCPARDQPIETRIPCRAGRRIQKNHDFDLWLPIFPDANYVVIWRRPMYSLMSFYEFAARSTKGVTLQRQRPFAIKKRKAHIWPHSARAWEQFAVENAEYWRRFVQKWAVAAQLCDNVRVFPYEAITREVDAAAELLDYCDVQFDRCWLQSYIAEQDERRFRSAKDFLYPVERTVPRVRKIIGEDVLALAGYDDVI